MLLLYARTSHRPWTTGLLTSFMLLPESGFPEQSERRASEPEELADCL